MKDYATLQRYVARLSDGEVLYLHRIVAQAAYPIYDRYYHGNWEQGVNAAKAKQRAEWEAHEAARQKSGEKWFTRSMRRRQESSADARPL